jgi:hypothetical protein
MTKPLTFLHYVEPIDADDWLETVEKKLQVVQCNNRNECTTNLQWKLYPDQAQQNYAWGRVDPVTMEEAQNASIMMPDTSLVNSILS